MRRKIPAGAARLALLGLALAMSIATQAGCDRSAPVSEIPEASRKPLEQRKVDLKPGKAKSAPAGGSLTKGRTNVR
jgi:hypothetical protein